MIECISSTANMSCDFLVGGLWRSIVGRDVSLRRRDKLFWGQSTEFEITVRKLRRVRFSFGYTIISVRELLWRVRHQSACLTSAVFDLRMTSGKPTRESRTARWLQFDDLRPTWSRSNACRFVELFRGRRRLTLIADFGVATKALTAVTIDQLDGVTTKRQTADVV